MQIINCTLILAFVYSSIISSGNLVYASGRGDLKVLRRVNRENNHKREARKKYGDFVKACGEFRSVTRDYENLTLSESANAAERMALTSLLEASPAETYIRYAQNLDKNECEHFRKKDIAIFAFKGQRSIHFLYRAILLTYKNKADYFLSVGGDEVNLTSLINSVTFQGMMLNADVDSEIRNGISRYWKNYTAAEKQNLIDLYIETLQAVSAQLYQFVLVHMPGRIYLDQLKYAIAHEKPILDIEEFYEKNPNFGEKSSSSGTSDSDSGSDN